MAIGFLMDVFRRHQTEPAFIWGDRAWTYQWLLEELERCASWIEHQDLGSAVASIEGDYSPRAVAVFLALAAKSCIVVPIAETVEGAVERRLRLAHVEFRLRLDQIDGLALEQRAPQIEPLHYSAVRRSKQPGLVLFTSGSSGQTKVAVHDISRLLGKFRVRGRRMKTLSFLLFDHIGGVNTLLYTLSNGGCLVMAPDRNPETVANLIESYRVELLPTTPTFLNLFLQSGAHRRHQMDSLRLVTYGTEAMREDLLRSLPAAFPKARLKQTYGLTETGILRSRSEDSQSVWIKLGGGEFETRVVDGKLQVKAESAMLGYLNAASPMTDDGWFVTGDRVEEKTNGYLRILGRESDLVNVGGLKVAPEQIEKVLARDPNLAEVKVYGRPSAMGGQELCADLRLVEAESISNLFPRLSKLCATTLSQHEIPTAFRVVDDPLHGPRFKTVPGGTHTRSIQSDASIGFVISGQGPRWPNTGLDLIKEEPIFRETLETFDQELARWTDWELLELLSSESGRRELNRTDRGQPAHFAYQVGLARLWANWGISPTAIVGHSMGEIAAAHLAGALSFEEAVRVVVERAAVCQEAAGLGKMAQVDSPMAEVIPVLVPWRDQLSVCAQNEPRSCVVAGTLAALSAFVDAAPAHGLQVKVLPFDYAFHSPVMRPYRQPLVARLEGLCPQETKVPLASTVRGTFIRGECLGPDYWGDNITQAVRFVDGVNLLMDSACDAFLEVGPHALLTYDVRECLAFRGYDAEVLHSLRWVRNPEDLDELDELKATLEKLISMASSPPVNGLQ